MSALGARTLRCARLPRGIIPALSVLAFGLAVIWLRPPLPIDETRYLEVFRESLQGSPLLLRLLGEPYAEKPPLLFWLARALTWLSIPPEFALRCLPPLALAATVVVTDRLGRRLGLTLAGWLQAVLLIASSSAQFLHFDPLAALTVWSALEAWVRRSSTGFVAWSAAALLAKGPVAYLFLIPFLLALTPLRERRSGDAARTALALVLALLPLAAWALAAAAQGGEEFARALLWERWAGRVAGSAPHTRAWYFYVPIVLVGSLPATFFLFRRGNLTGQGGAHEWSSRLGWMLLLVLLLFSLINGKQAHYLEPAAPGLALFLARAIESRPHEIAWLRRGIRVQFGLLLALAVLAAFLVPRAERSLGTQAIDLIARGGLDLPLAITATIALAGLAATWRERLSARALLAVTLLGVGSCLLPIHWLAGELVFPHALADALRLPPEDIALLGTSHHGLYALLASTDEIEKLQDEDELATWSALHPGGLLLVDPKHLSDGLPGGLVPVASDRVHRMSVLVLRRGSDS